MVERVGLGWPLLVPAPRFEDGGDVGDVSRSDHVLARASAKEDVDSLGGEVTVGTAESECGADREAGAGTGAVAGAGTETCCQSPETSSSALSLGGGRLGRRAVGLRWPLNAGGRRGWTGSDAGELKGVETEDDDLELTFSRR